MGLDITLYKILKNKNEISDSEKYISFEDKDSQEYNKFVNYFGEESFCVKTLSYYDYDKVGITDDKYIQDGVVYNDKPYIILINKTHELYPIYYRLLKTPIDNDSILDDNEQFLLTKYGYEKDINTSLFKWLKLTLQSIKYFDDIPTFDKNIQVIYIKEIGYQRKGMNGDFYSNYTDDDYYVFEKSKLQYIYDNYVVEDKKEYFKSNILEPFIEGEHVVEFWW